MWQQNDRSTLLAFIALSDAQSSEQTHIHINILVIDTSNNAPYNLVHWLVWTPYLLIKASNDVNTFYSIRAMGHAAFCMDHKYHFS